jgi:peroxiredoxin
LPAIARWQREFAALNIVLVSEGTAKDNAAKTDQYGLNHVLLQKKREVADAYLANGTPAAVFVQPDGTIGSPMAYGVDRIRALMASALGLAPPPQSSVSATPAFNGRPGPSVSTPALKPVELGESVPSIKLPALDGKTVALPSLRGQRTMLLFWNNGCGFCRAMLDDLRAWEANPPSGAPRLVVISSGRAEENRAMDLRSLVLLDHDLRASAAFGANGTPMAVLMDDQARVASKLAAGAVAVVALANAAANIRSEGLVGAPH